MIKHDPAIAAVGRCQRRLGYPRCHGRLRTAHRAAVSLLEAILALAIMGTSLALLAQVMDAGVDAGREAHELAACRVVCQRRLSELLLNVDAGVVPVASVGTAVSDFADPSTRTMMCDIAVMPGALNGLTQVRVTIHSVGGDGMTPIASCSLTRWIVDPSLDLEGLEEQMKAESEDEAEVI